MNTGQTLITIFGLVLLATLVLRMNSSSHTVSVDLHKNKLNVMAVSLVTSYIEEIKQRAFDENSFEKAVSNESSLSTYLGKDAGESRSDYNDMYATDFNDVDDYNGDSTEIQLEPVSGLESPIFYLKCKVEYFNPSNGTTTPSKKFHKKITVTCSSNSLTDTFSLSTVYSYWKFR